MCVFNVFTLFSGRQTAKQKKNNTVHFYKSILYPNVQKVQSKQSPGRAIQRAISNLFDQSFTFPKHSMYGIFTYIGVVSGVNAGKYSIHGVLGYLVASPAGRPLLPDRLGSTRQTKALKVFTTI